MSTFGIFVWTFSNILFEFFFGLFRRRTNDRQNTNARNTNSGRVENGDEDGVQQQQQQLWKTTKPEFFKWSFRRSIAHEIKHNNNNKIELKCTVTLELLIPVSFRSTLFPLRLSSLLLRSRLSALVCLRSMHVTPTVCGQYRDPSTKNTLSLFFSFLFFFTFCFLFLLKNSSSNS